MDVKFIKLLVEKKGKTYYRDCCRMVKKMF